MTEKSISFTKVYIVFYILLEVTSAQKLDLLQFDLLFKNNFVNDYKELTSPVTIILKSAIENKFSEILTSFVSEFESTDVTQFQNREGHSLARCEVTFAAPLDFAKESLVVFHIRTLLAEAGWKILTENGPAEIQVIMYNFVIQTNGKLEIFQVPLGTADKCVIFNKRKACQNGGTCHVEEDNPVCWCARDYIGTYCEGVYTATNLKLRLVEGGFSWGFLEVTSGQNSGVICASDWAESTLQVACRQLGFQGGQRLVIPDTHLYSVNTILLDHVRCYGNESNLGQCLHSEVQSSVCSQDQQLIVLCSDVTDVMKLSVIFKEKSQNGRQLQFGIDHRVLKDTLSSKFNSMYKSINDFSFTDVLSFSNVGRGLQTDFQIMYNHRMGPIRQAVALQSLSKIMESYKYDFALDAKKHVAVKDFFLTSTNNNAHSKLNVSLLDYDLCQLLTVKKSCLNGGQCQILDSTAYCKCPNGFTGSFCEEDIDECAKKSDCAHRCENIVGGYKCHCNETFRSFEEGRVCEQMALPVRLVRGGLGWGRVEVSNLGRWGSVCMSGWDMADAEVVCRELGFPGSYASFHADAILRRSTTPVWLSEISCLGAEKALDDCAHSRWGMHHCNHDSDVGVICNHVVNILQFEITLGMPWLSEYESATGPLTMSLRQDLQDRFSDLFVEHSSSDGLGSVDVLKFRAGPDGSTIASMEVTFEYQLDVTSQSLASFFLMDVVKESGGNFRMPSLPVTVPIRAISVKTQDSCGKMVTVVLSDANRCALFDLKQSCLNGSHCIVEGTTPVCKCPPGREGLYCERVPIVDQAATTVQPSLVYRPLVTELHRVVVNMAIDRAWKTNFSNRNHRETMQLTNHLKKSLEHLYRGVKDKLSKITIIEIYPAQQGIGYLHLAEFVQVLQPEEQANIATRIFREIDDHDQCILIDHKWDRVILGPRFRYEGQERDTFAELTISSPCSLHNARSLCLNGGYCKDDIGLPRCFCSAYHTGDFCEIALGGGLLETSILISYFSIFVFLLGMSILLKMFQTFRRKMYCYMLSDYNANIPAKSSLWQIWLVKSSEKYSQKRP